MKFDRKRAFKPGMTNEGAQPMPESFLNMQSKFKEYVAQQQVINEKVKDELSVTALRN